MDRIWANLNELTQFAIILICMIGVGFHVRWNRRNTALGPTFLTTLGIFFCFTGIAWGLLSFDPADIRSSVPHLLDGIRTSFWASVAGIFWALTLKGRVALFGEAPLPVSGEQRGASINDLAEHLAKLNEGMTVTHASLAALNASFERYSERIVEVNTSAVTQALQTVVQEFNSQVSASSGLPKIAQSLNELGQQMQQTVLANQQQLSALMSRSIDSASRELSAQLRKSSEDVGKHVVALDRALEEELTRSIESLGRQLTALSQKFVQDYTPLTVSLQRLLHGARA